MKESQIWKGIVDFNLALLLLEGFAFDLCAWYSDQTHLQRKPALESQFGWWMFSCPPDLRGAFPRLIVNSANILFSSGVWLLRKRVMERKEQLQLWPKGRSGHGPDAVPENADSILHRSREGGFSLHATVLWKCGDSEPSAGDMLISWLGFHQSL